MATEDEGFSEAEHHEAESLEQVSNRLDRIEEILAKLVPTGTHADAQQRTERRLERPSTVEDQVREELAKRDRQAAEQRDRDETKQELADLRAKLTEAKPQPPEPRRTRIMWGSARASH